MTVTDDQLDPEQAASRQAFEKAAPMHLGLGQFYGDSPYPTLSISRPPDRHPHRAIDDLPGGAHPLITGIEKDVGRFAQGAFTPCIQADIQRLGSAADLGR